MSIRLNLALRRPFPVATVKTTWLRSMAVRPDRHRSSALDRPQCSDSRRWLEMTTASLLVGAGINREILGGCSLPGSGHWRGNAATGQGWPLLGTGYGKRNNGTRPEGDVQVLRKRTFKKMMALITARSGRPPRSQHQFPCPRGRNIKALSKPEEFEFASSIKG